MLNQFLEDMARQPFVDGERDCALTVADWVVRATGCADPAAHLRGRYRTPIGRARILNRFGGLKTVMVTAAEHAGLAETDAPQRGDVGLIRVGKRQFAAICLGTRWAVKGQGLEVMPADTVIRAWRV